MGEKLLGIAVLIAVIAFVIFAFRQGFRVPPRQGPDNNFTGRDLTGRD